MLISPIIYTQLFHTKIISQDFLCLDLYFLARENKEKVVHKMLVKLTTGKKDPESPSKSDKKVASEKEGNSREGPKEVKSKKKQGQGLLLLKILKHER